MGWGTLGPSVAQPCQVGQGLAERMQLSSGPAGWSGVSLAQFGPGLYRAGQQAGLGSAGISIGGGTWRGRLGRYCWSWGVLAGSGGETTMGLMGPPPFNCPSVVLAPPHQGQSGGARGRLLAGPQVLGGPAGLHKQKDCSEL